MKFEEHWFFNVAAGRVFVYKNGGKGGARGSRIESSHENKLHT